MSDLDGTTRRRPPSRTDRDEAVRARLAVAHHANDPDDCRALLSMLGLLPDPIDPSEEPSK